MFTSTKNYKLMEIELYLKNGYEQTLVPQRVLYDDGVYTVDTIIWTKVKEPS